jgi:hypothetical protein
LSDVTNVELSFQAREQFAVGHPRKARIAVASG